MEAFDFMDPRRRLQHNVMVIIGYVLIGIALLLLTTILLFVAYGFGLKDGRVIQNGLLFVSSTPSSAQIYIDGVQNSNTTNTKLELAEGNYQFVLTRAGYRDWLHTIAVTGGVVQTYAYPLLFPTNLTTTTMHTYTAAPGLMSESLDQHWLLVAQPNTIGSFDLYDLTNPTQAPTIVALPAGLLTAGTGTEQLTAVAWGDDNTHVLLKHTVGSAVEYILFNRQSPDQSVNLTKTLALPTTGIDLRLVNSHADRYLVFNTATHELSKASLSTPQLQPYLTNVLAFATTGDNFVLYATPDPLDATKVSIDLNDGSNNYIIRQDKAGETYLLNLAIYNGDMYLGVSAAQDNIAFVYKNPLQAITNQLIGVAVPTQVIRITAPTAVAFSPSGQYVMFENGSDFATYDVQADQAYRYTVSDRLDTPQTQATWMDGAHLSYISKGQIVVMDFDGQNRQALVSADPHYPLAFAQSGKYLYDLVPAPNDKAQELLTSTALRTPGDL